MRGSLLFFPEEVQLLKLTPFTTLYCFADMPDVISLRVPQPFLKAHQYHPYFESLFRLTRFQNSGRFPYSIYDEEVILLLQMIAFEKKTAF